jgi:muramoyltetrapeptide carboxypeptidase
MRCRIEFKIATLLIIVIIAIPFSCVSEPIPQKIKPKFLEIGDTIAFCAPSGFLDSTRMSLAKRRLEEKGFHVVQSNSLFQNWGYLAGNDEARANELMHYFKDKSVKAIFPGTGGYGATRILPLLDFDIISNNPKIFIGFSDITALHIALNNLSNMVTFHTPNPMYGLGSKDGLEPISEFYFWSLLMDQSNSYEVPFNIYNDSLSAKILVPGIASGVLVGGNLSLICSVMGSKYEIKTANSILFIEDIGESPYRIDRYLQELKLAGKFDDLNGLIIGRFSRRQSEEPDKPTDFKMEEVFSQYFSNLKVPVIYDFPAGHGSKNISIPFGVKVEINTENQLFKLLESPLSANK